MSALITPELGALDASSVIGLKRFVVKKEEVIEAEDSSLIPA